MIKAMRVNNTVVCTINQKMYQKACSTTEEILSLYDMALNTDENNADEVLLLIEQFLPTKTKEEIVVENQIKQLEQEVKSQQVLKEWFEDIEKNGSDIFELVGFKLYVKGINITIPEFLAIEFAKRKDNPQDLSSLLNFWRLLALNPDPKCREDLYSFLVKNDLSITPSGYFVTYRNVLLKNESTNPELEKTILESWLKVKKWKKNTPNYNILMNHETGFYELVHVEKTSQLLNETMLDKDYDEDYDDEEDKYCSKYSHIGNLRDLHQKLSTEDLDTTIYTDAHTRTFEIKIGELVSIDRNQCDADPNRLCSNGLHSGNLNFMNSQGSYFGNVGIICLINPMDVVAVPTSYDGKMRSCAYLPIALTEYDSDGKIIPVDTQTFEYEYAKHTEAELEEMIRKYNNNFESLKEHNIIPKELTLSSLKQALTLSTVSLSEMQEVINNRIKTV